MCGGGGGGVWEVGRGGERGQPKKRAVNPPPPAPGLSDSACALAARGERKGSAFKGRSAVWRVRTGLNRARKWSCGDTVSLTVRAALGLGVDLVTVRRWGFGGRGWG